MNKNNTSNYTGIYYDEDFKKWVMRVPLLEKWNGRKLMHTEMFTDVEDAVDARKAKLIEVYGQDYLP